MLSLPLSMTRITDSRHFHTILLPVPAPNARKPPHAIYEYCLLFIRFAAYPIIHGFIQTYLAFYCRPAGSSQKSVGEIPNITPSPDAHDIATASARVRPVVGHAR